MEKFFENEEITKKFNEWWRMSFKGNVPINHINDLNRFIELIKATFDKQDVFNSSVLRQFLYNQIENGNLNKNQKDEIEKTIELYEFGVKCVS